MLLQAFQATEGTAATLAIEGIPQFSATMLTVSESGHWKPLLTSGIVCFALFFFSSRRWLFSPRPLRKGEGEREGGNWFRLPIFSFQPFLARKGDKEGEIRQRPYNSPGWVLTTDAPGPPGRNYFPWSLFG